jgi:hypothetical protein
MARKSIVIAFNFPDDRQLVSDRNLVGRVLDLQEELERVFLENGQGIVNDVGWIDINDPKLSVTLSSNHLSGSALSSI